MANEIDKLKFNPPRGFNDHDAFPNPIDEEMTREQLQRLHDQTRDYINQVVNLLAEKGANFIKTESGISIGEAVKYMKIPIATVEDLGGVIVGNNLTINHEGKLSAVAEIDESIPNSVIESICK